MYYSHGTDLAAEHIHLASVSQQDETKVTAAQIAASEIVEAAIETVSNSLDEHLQVSSTVA